jgi:TrpR-related protein YerC/YecD
MVAVPSNFKEAIMAAKTRDHLTDQLFKAILSLKDEGQCSNFFEDICTISELKSMAQRLEVARMLDAGSIYEEIVEKTGASTATISRVKRCLVYGADGYNSVMPILKKEEKPDAE